MKSYKIIAFFAILVFSACTERIDFELNNEEFQRVVVEGWITNETKAHKVSLRLTSDYLDPKTPEPVTGAIVKISDGNQTYDLSEIEPGDYFTANNVTGETGKTYVLTIDWNGQTHTASCYLNEKVDIEAVAYEEEEEEDDVSDDIEFTEYVVYLFTTEPEGEGDHYYWKSFPIDSPDDPTRTEWEIASDEFVDGNAILGAEILYIDSDIHETWVFEQYSITEETFDFFIGIQSETIFKGGIFDAAPANIKGNVDNGALGFFAAASVARDTFTVE